jgi:hypothetical protein
MIATLATNQKFLKRTTLLIETSLCALKPLIKARRLKREGETREQ